MGDNTSAPRAAARIGERTAATAAAPKTIRALIAKVLVSREARVFSRSASPGVSLPSCTSRVMSRRILMFGLNIWA